MLKFPRESVFVLIDGHDHQGMTQNEKILSIFFSCRTGGGALIQKKLKPHCPNFQYTKYLIFSTIKNYSNMPEIRISRAHYFYLATWYESAAVDWTVSGDHTAYFWPAHAPIRVTFIEVSYDLYADQISEISVRLQADAIAA